MTPYSCIIFDMDGTLTATNRLIFDSFNHIVTREGKEPMSDEAIMALFGPPEEGALAKIVGTEKLGDAMEEYLSYYEQNHRDRAAVHSGMKELLGELKSAGKTTAVFTGKGTHTTRITLEQLHMQDLFDIVVTGNDVDRHKPSGDGIMKIMSQTGHDQASTIMIGDSASDIKAAREAGVAVVSVLWDAHDPDKVLAHRPDFVFQTVQELTEWLCG